MVLVDQRGGAREHRAAGGEIDEGLRSEHLRVRVETVATRESGGDARVRTLCDPESGGCVEEPGREIPLHVLDGVPDRETAAKRRQRKPHVLERHGVAARSAHAERVPVVMDDHARGSARDHRVAVPLTAAVVRVGDGGVEDVGGGRHRAEHLVPGDDPARLGALRRRRRAREILPQLAAGGDKDGAVFRDLL